MKRIFLPLALGAKVDVTPVQKVVEMLTGMSAKGKEAKHAEEVQFASYKQWCGDSETEKSEAIKQGKERVDFLSANILKLTSDAEDAESKVTEMNAEIGTKEGDIKAAKEVRERERTDYQNIHKEYTESIDALGRAVIVLQQQDHDRSQAKAFLSEDAITKVMSAEQKKVIEKFLQQDPELGEIGGPEAHGYEFQSGGVIDMLQKLKEKFVEERSEMEKEESNKRHAYEMLLQDKQSEVEGHKTSRTNFQTTSGKKRQAAADQSGELTDTKNTLEDDTSFLTEVTATCKSKSDDFETRQKLRGEELQAIEKAIEILSGHAVAGAAEQHLPSFLQRSLLQTGTSYKKLFLNKDRSHPTSADMNKLVQEYLLTQSEKIHSRVLSTMAMKVGDDPLDKVKKMINDLIMRLVQEAGEEATHKGWCNTELKSNKETRDTKTKAVDTLRSEIDQLTANIAQNTDQVAELQVQIADQVKLKQEATDTRGKEKIENEATIKDSQDAQMAVEKALTVLKDFYARAGSSTAFVQAAQKRNTLDHQLQQAPAIFGDTPYQGVGETGGVMAMLEVIVSDFARLESETRAAESQSEKEHTSFMTKTAIDLAQKNTDVKHKEANKQNMKQSLVDKETDLASTTTELKAALEYYDSLKPSCVDAGISYEERVARRKEEIESLQEALRILNGEDMR